MPTLSDLRRRISPERPLVTAGVAGEEVMVIDRRSRLRPTQVIEQKLRTALSRDRIPREATDAAAARS